MIYPSESDLKPVITRLVFDKLLLDKEAQRREYLRCRIEPWYWLVNYVYTKRKDENVASATVERFPADEYLKIIFDTYFREPYVAVDKSRQMRLTWLFMAYGLFWAQFYDNEEVIGQSKTELIADTELVKRAQFMFEQQPIWMRQSMNPSFCLMTFSNGSVIRGIPSGAHKVRSYNPTRMGIDECGFLEGEFEECKDDALACCKDIKLFSSAMAGDWGEFINAAA